MIELLTECYMCHRHTYSQKGICWSCERQLIKDDVKLIEAIKTGKVREMLRLKTDFGMRDPLQIIKGEKSNG